MRPKDRISDEIVGFAGCVPADLTLMIACPEFSPTGRAGLPNQPLGFEIIELVIFFAHGKPRVITIFAR
jgi:hypothetical protein